MLEIRRLEEGDMEQAVVLGKYVHSGGKMSVTEWNEEKFLQSIRTLIEHQNGVPMGVFDETNLIGYMLAVTEPTFLGIKPVLTCFAWFVHEAYRDAGAGTMIINFMKIFAEQEDIKEIRMEGPLEIQKYMEHKGFTTTGCNFLMRID